MPVLDCVRRLERQDSRQCDVDGQGIRGAPVAARLQIGIEGTLLHQFCVRRDRPLVIHCAGRRREAEPGGVHTAFHRHADPTLQLQGVRRLRRHFIGDAGRHRRSMVDSSELIACVRGVPEQLNAVRDGHAVL